MKNRKKQKEDRKKKRRRRIRRPRLPQILYLLFLIGTIIFVSNRGGAFSYALFYAAAAYPVIAFLYLLICRASLRMDQELHGRDLKKGLGTPYQLKLVNAGFLPIASVILHAYDRRGSFREDMTGQVLSLLPKEKMDFETSLSCRYSGHYQAGISRVEFRDSFDLIRLSLRPAAPLFVRVLPMADPESSEEIVREFLSRSMAASGGRTGEWEDILGNDLKPYLPGDPLKRIHWKNYARNKELMVRLPEEKDLQVFSVVMKARPLCDPDVSEEEQVIRDLRRRDHFLERVVSVAAFLAGIGKPAQFLYFNAGVSRLLVENYDGLQELCSALSGDLVLRGDMERADLELMLEAERWQFPVLTLTESEDYDGMDGTDTTDREEVGSLQGKASESEGIDGSPARGQTAGA